MAVMHEVKFECNWRDIIVVESWIIDNCTGNYSYSRANPHCVVYFEDETDAVAFKLRWI